MRYENIREATFLSRPNRFIAYIEIEGRQELCHVKNTGRCRELLLPGAPVMVQEMPALKRKTGYDLIGVYKADRLINIDSQVPNRVFREWLEERRFFNPLTRISPEYRYHNSRLDFYIESGPRRIMAEIKGVTLEENGVALFPDAPTERGVKHLTELVRAAAEGWEAYLFFIVQMAGVRYLAPNAKTHPAFATALLNAQRQGVQVLALDCTVTADSITARDWVEVRADP